MIVETYCAKSKYGECSKTNCKRNLNNFNGIYVSLSDEFICSKELETNENLMENKKYDFEIQNT